MWSWIDGDVTEMRRSARAVLAGAVAVLCASAGFAQADPVPLQLGYSDKESSYFLLGNGPVIPAMPGIAIEMVEAAAVACDVAPHFTRYPGSRMLALAQENSIDAIVMVSFTPERQAIGVYPMQGDAADPAFQIATLTYAFYTRRDSDISWDGKAFTGLERPIGVNLGWSVGNDLKAMGLPVETAKDTQNNFNKLLLERIDAFAIQTSIGSSYIRDNNLAERVRELTPAISSKPYYLVFSHGWYDQHPAAAKCLWQSIANQHKTGMKALLERYHDTIN